MTDISIWSLVANASLVVQLVMLSLLAMSVITWGIIAYKYFLYQSQRQLLEQFEKTFWTQGDLQAIYDNLPCNTETAQEGIVNVFCSGFKDYLRLHSSMPEKQHKLDLCLASIKRVMRVAIANEDSILNKHLALLASCGSVSPYIGLFGTVWGIMNAFLGLAASSNASLAAVAPGIAEALIATAMGIFVAIPAVVAYNQYSTRSEQLLSEYEVFAEEFIGILQRRIH
jgi:biopolymer transport protein TolQ